MGHSPSRGYRHLSISTKGGVENTNNLCVDNIFNTKSERFGFTSEEIEYICSKFGRPEKFDELKEWYDGYRFGKGDVYNPWSVMNCVQNDFEPYTFWANTSSNIMVKELFSRTDEDTYKTLLGLASGTGVVRTVQPSLTFDDLARSSSIYTLMTLTGYLKAVPAGTYDSYTLTIPNKEISRLFTDLISEMYFDDQSFFLSQFSNQLISGDVEGLKDTLYTIITSSASSRIFTHEHVYQAFVLGMLLHKSGRYTVTADFENGKGYYDVLLKSRNGVNPNILLEIKRTDSESSLEKEAQSALKQIRERDYAFGLKGKTIIYGMSFCGKVPLILKDTL